MIYLLFFFLPANAFNFNEAKILFYGKELNLGGSGLPIIRRQILDSSKLKDFADDNFKFDKNGRKLSKRLENTVGKGEIARYEQFLLFQQCFQNACFPGASKGVIVWEWVKYQFRALAEQQLHLLCCFPQAPFTTGAQAIYNTLRLE